MRSIVGGRFTGALGPTDLTDVARAELDLLRSIDFDFAIETPFAHFEKWKQTLMEAIVQKHYHRHLPHALQCGISRCAA
jgi:hypothetical protein